MSASSSSEALVKGWTPMEEKTSITELNEDNPLQIVVVPIEGSQESGPEKSIDEDEIAEYPDLGSDQVFPFAAGLDSY